MPKAPKEVMRQMGEAALLHNQVANSSSSDCLGDLSPQQAVRHAIGQVGLFGVIAIMFDYFGKNPSGYQSWRWIQFAIRQFDQHSRDLLEIVEDPIDAEVDREESVERNRKWGIVELRDRKSA